MKKCIIFLVLILSFASPIFGQIDFFSFDNKSSPSTCPTTGMEILDFDYWEVYQTLDDKYDGKIDSSLLCNTLKKGIVLLRYP